MKALEHNDIEKFSNLVFYVIYLNEDDALSMFQDFKMNPINFIIENLCEINEKSATKITELSNWDYFFDNSIESVSNIIRKNIIHHIKNNDKKEIETITKLGYLAYLSLEDIKNLLEKSNNFSSLILEDNYSNSVLLKYHISLIKNLLLNS